MGSKVMPLGSRSKPLAADAPNFAAQLVPSTKPLIISIALNTEETEITEDNACPSIKAYFRLLPNGRIRIFLRKQTVSESLFQDQFLNGQFVVSVPLDIPKKMVNRLGIEPYTIQPGTYPVVEDEHFIFIDL